MVTIEQTDTSSCVYDDGTLKTGRARAAQRGEILKEPMFDIFSGESDKNPLWIEAVEGLSEARERLEQIAAKKPGKYFLFSGSSAATLIKIETFENGPAVTKCYAVASGSNA